MVPMFSCGHLGNLEVCGFRFPPAGLGSRLTPTGCHRWAWSPHQFPLGLSTPWAAEFRPLHLHVVLNHAVCIHEYQPINMHQESETYPPIHVRHHIISLSLSLSISLNIYIYVCICVCFSLSLSVHSIYSPLFLPPGLIPKFEVPTLNLRGAAERGPCPR